MTPGEVMFPMYLLIDGTVTSKAEIEQAFAAGTAVLIHGRGDHRTTTGLALHGREYDNRGTCHSVWEETWTRKPATVVEALRAAAT
jgi:hypothetical protein